MNCEAVNYLLDTKALEALTPNQRRAIDEHLASCCECRDAWAAYRELALTAIPSTPPELRGRIAAALVTAGRARPPRPRRAAAVAALLLVGAAAASTVFYQLFDGTAAPPSPAIEGAVLPNEAQPATPAAEAAPIVSLSPEPISASDGTEGSGDPAAAPAQHALDAFSIVVLALPNPTIPEEAAGFFAQCYDDVVRELRAIDGLNVIAAEQVAPFSGSNVAPEQVARELGARSALVIGTADRAALERIAAVRAELGLVSRVGSCEAEQIDAQTTVVRAVAARMHPEWSADESRTFAEDVAETVREATLEDPAALIARAQATVLDPAVDANDRIDVLARLREGREYVEPIHDLIRFKMAADPIPGAFDAAIVAAAANIGVTSSDPRTRQSAWRHLRGIRDPNLTQALLYSIGNDIDENVRCQAALALGYLVEEPGVRDALRRAAAEDQEEKRSDRPGCILSVRGAAERALKSDAELRAAALDTVLDARLPSAERLAPLYESVDGRGLPVQLDEAAAQAVFEIGRSAADAPVRARAWEALGSSRLPEITPTLLDDLANHPAEDVRAAAATTLRPYADDAEVRAGLEAALADASLAVRRAAQRALERGTTE